MLSIDLNSIVNITRTKIFYFKMCIKKENDWTNGSHYMMSLSHYHPFIICNIILIGKGLSNLRTTCSIRPKVPFFFQWTFSQFHVLYSPGTTTNMLQRILGSTEVTAATTTIPQPETLVTENITMSQTLFNTEAIAGIAVVGGVTIALLIILLLVLTFIRIRKKVFTTHQGNFELSLKNSNIIDSIIETSSNEAYITHVPQLSDDLQVYEDVTNLDPAVPTSSNEAYITHVPQFSDDLQLYEDVTNPDPAVPTSSNEAYITHVPQLSDDLQLYEDVTNLGPAVPTSSNEAYITHVPQLSDDLQLYEDVTNLDPAVPTSSNEAYITHVPQLSDDLQLYEDVTNLGPAVPTSSTEASIPTSVPKSSVEIPSTPIQAIYNVANDTNGDALDGSIHFTTLANENQQQFFLSKIEAYGTRADVP